MKFMLTTSSRRAINQIKAQMLKQYEEGDVNRFKLKFTKKKEFMAVPVPYFNGPSFQLFINDKFYKTYFLHNNRWRGVS